MFGSTGRRTRLVGVTTLAAAVVTILGGAPPAQARSGGHGEHAVDVPAAIAAAAVPTVVDGDLPTTGDAEVRVIVRAAPQSVTAAAQLVARLGGDVRESLPLVDGFAATLPARRVGDLAASGLVRVVSLDRPLAVQGSGSETSRDPVHLRETGVLEARADGATGEGVTVALLDTGVAAVEDLEGRLVTVRDHQTGLLQPCQNFSGESGCADSYGHGTFIAGLIAGSGTSSAGQHTGAAPGAQVLSVKVAGRSGATDVSTVLAAIQWVVSFQSEYGIDVLNLSLGTDSTQPWRTDPLNYAVERAWDAGITVVVSAANLGPEPGTVTKPADDPLVITVGSVDDRGTPGVDDDRLPDYSSRGPTADGLAKPDVVAPGSHLTSLRAPGSRIEEEFPDGAGGAYRKGSGTSFAAGVVSGAVAALLEERPLLTPDQVKAVLMATARPVASDDPLAVGAGLIDLPAALQEPVGTVGQTAERSSGQGSLDASRGTLGLRLDDPLGTVLTGRQTAQLALWDPVGFTGLAWTGSTWYTTAHATLGWNTAWFEGGEWTGHNWTGHNWTGSTWYGSPDGSTTYGRPTDGSASFGAWD